MGAQEGECEEPSGKACDNWRLFREDVKLVASLGHRAYRYSVEWSRIEPEEGRFDPAALDHYKEMSELLKRNGIATYVTLNHFTVPQWFAARGGFQERENIPYFLRYVEKVVKALAGLVDSYLVFNESFHTRGDSRRGLQLLDRPCAGLPADQVVVRCSGQFRPHGGTAVSEPLLRRAGPADGGVPRFSV